MKYQEVFMIRDRFYFCVIAFLYLVLFLLAQGRVTAAFDSDITDACYGL